MPARSAWIVCIEQYRLGLRTIAGWLETLAEIHEVKAKELGTFSAEGSLHKIAATEYKKLAKHYTTQRDLRDSNWKEKKSNEVSVSLPTLSRHLLDNKRNGDNFQGQVIEAQILLWEEQCGCYIAKALDEVAGTAAWLKSSYKTDSSTTTTVGWRGRWTAHDSVGWGGRRTRYNSASDQILDRHVSRTVRQGIYKQVRWGACRWRSRATGWWLTWGIWRQWRRCIWGSILETYLNQ